MAYEKPIKIKEAIASIEDGDYVLPAIQREFVSLFARLRKLNLYILRLTPLGLCTSLDHRGDSPKWRPGWRYPARQDTSRCV